MRIASVPIGTGFFVDKDAANMPNDQAITHRQIRVIRATGTGSDRRSREGRCSLPVVLTATSGPND
jgi:hypothetical protein